MNKSIIFAAAAAIVSGVASADYMKWMVDTSALSNAAVEGGGTDAAAVSAMQNYAYAVLVQSDDATHQSGTSYFDTGVLMSSYVGNSSDTAELITPDVFSSGSTIAAADVGSTVKYFYIELLDAQGTLLGYSTTGADLSSSEFAQFKETSRFSSNWSNTNAWGGGSYTAVPEPTSGLMLLVGVAMLGLRRKRA